jgi:hypothetical protein
MIVSPPPHQFITAIVSFIFYFLYSYVHTMIGSLLPAIFSEILTGDFGFQPLLSMQAQGLLQRKDGSRLSGVFPSICFITDKQIDELIVFFSSLFN